MIAKTTTHKLLFLTAILLSVLACSKDSSNCETWRFWDECVPKNSATYCTNPPAPNIVTTKLCGNSLDGVSVGASKVVNEDVNRKTVRHFLEKIN